MNPFLAKENPSLNPSVDAFLIRTVSSRVVVEREREFDITYFPRIGSTTKTTKLKLLKSLFNDILYITSRIAFYKYF